MSHTNPAQRTRLFGLPLGRVRAAPRVWRLGQADMPSSGEFVALVPGAEAPLLSVNLPATLKGSAREGVALRQLRDRLGSGADTLEFRPAPLAAHDERWSRVLAADRMAVSRWRSQASGARGRCRAILPDFLALPTAPGLWTLQTEPGANDMQVQARLGPQDGFSAEAPLAVLLLAQALERAKAQGVAPSAILRLGPPEAALDGVLDGLAVYHSSAALPAGLPPPRIMAHGEMALDLGRDLRATADAAQARLLALRWPVALAVIGIITWAIGLEYQTRREIALAEAIGAANIAAVRRDFLPTGPLLDIPVQVTRELERRQMPGTDADDARGALDLLHASAERIAASPARLISLVMQPENGLTLELEMTDFGTLETLRDDLLASGLPVQVTRSGTEPDGSVTASLMITHEGGL